MFCVTLLTSRTTHIPSRIVFVNCFGGGNDIFLSVSFSLPLCVYVCMYVCMYVGGLYGYSIAGVMAVPEIL